MKRIEAILVKEETVFNVFKLKSMIQENDSLAILMYGSPDPDAVASALALQEIMRKLGGLSNSILVATELVVRQQNLDFIKAMRVSIQLLDKVDLAQYRLLAIVDAQPSFFGDALGEFKPQIVIDHHPCATVWHAQVADVRPSYGSLSTILTEYLLAAKIRISRKLHTALLYGIKADTGSFEREVSLEDIGAYYLNFAKANRELIRRIEMNQIPERYLKYYDYAYHNRHRWRDRIVSFLGRVDSADVCVQVADFFLRVVNIYYVVIAGIVKDRLIVVFRGDGYRQDCGAIADKAFGAFGKAGGHRSAARVEISLESLRDVIQQDFSQENIERFLIQRLHRKRKMKKNTNHH